jgi:hypothetical protein
LFLKIARAFEFYLNTQSETKGQVHSKTWLRSRAHRIHKQVVTYVQFVWTRFKNEIVDLDNVKVFATLSEFKKYRIRTKDFYNQGVNKQ